MLRKTGETGTGELQDGSPGAASLAALALASALLSTHHFVAHLARGGPIDLAHVVFSGFAQWTPWLAMAPAIMGLVRRAGLHLPSDRRNGTLLLGGGVGMALVAGSVEYALRSLAPAGAGIGPTAAWRAFVARGLAFDLAVYAALASLAHLVELRSAQRATELVARRLEHELGSLRSGPAPGDLGRLQIQVGGRIRLVATADVDWIEAAGNYVVLHVAREAHLYRSSLRALEGRLGRGRFVRVHRSALVNVSRIRELSPWAGGDYRLTLVDGTVLRLSRTHRRRFDLVTGRRR